MESTPQKACGRIIEWNPVHSAELTFAASPGFADVAQPSQPSQVVLVELKPMVHMGVPRGVWKMVKPMGW